jgi:hypothetical protein
MAFVVFGKKKILSIISAGKPLFFRRRSKGEVNENMGERRLLHSIELSERPTHLFSSK